MAEDAMCELNPIQCLLITRRLISLSCLEQNAVKVAVSYIFSPQQLVLPTTSKVDRRGEVTLDQVLQLQRIERYRCAQLCGEYVRSRTNEKVS